MFQLSKFAKSPSSAQIIFEEKKLTGRELASMDRNLKDEIISLKKREKKPSVIKQQQDAVFRLEKSGMETNRSVANLGKSISGVKITTDGLLDKNVLKNLVAKKREPTFPDK